MSENKFKVPAKSRVSSSDAASAKKTKGTAPVKKSAVNTAQSKLEKAKVTRKPASFPQRSLPDVQDMGNMTREERINAVLKREGVKVRSTKQQKESTEKKAADRYSGMKKVIAGSKAEEGRKRKPEPVYEKKDNSGLYIRIAAAALAVIFLLIVLVLIRRAGSSSDASSTAVSSDAMTSAAHVEDSAEPGFYSHTVEITKGMGAGEVSRLFEPVLDSDEFLSYLVDSGLTTSIQPGIYIIDSSMTAEEAAHLITSRVENNSVTIYAGYTLEDIDRMLWSRGFAGRRAFLSACDELASEYGMSFVEGYLMSGVYEFTDVHSLAYSMLSSTLDWFRSHSQELASSSLSMDDAVRIASMVNRETQDEEQMPVIAAVILNRIEEDMPLGIDATTRYELDDWTGDLPQSAYEKITPYNTRRQKGLPPSGIGCPSPASLESVLEPADTGALYYLHDKQGRLYTSSTYEEHLKTYERLY